MPVTHVILLALAAITICACAPIRNMQAGDEAWRWAPAEPGPAAADPLNAGPPVRVFVAPELRQLMERLEPRYEALAGVDLQLVFDAHLDTRAAEDQLILRATRGEAPDLLLLESAARIGDLTRRPRAWAPLALNQIVAIAPAHAPMAPREALEGTVPLAIALERSALGRASREALQHAGAWRDVHQSAGRYDHADAICEAIAHAAEQDPPRKIVGFVYRTAAMRAARAEPDPRRRCTVIAALASPPEAPAVHAMAIWSDAGRTLGDWLRSDIAQSEMRRLGFTPVPPTAASSAWRAAVTLDDELLRTGAP